MNELTMKSAGTVMHNPTITSTMAGEISFQTYAAGTEKKNAHGAITVIHRQRL